VSTARSLPTRPAGRVGRHVHAGDRPDTIVLADDDAGARAALAGPLRRAAYEVLEVQSGEAALEAVRRAMPAVLVLEVCLPDVSGYAICWELRDEFGEEPKIVLVSDRRCDSVDRVAGLLVGADECLPKTICGDELVVRIARLAGRSRRRRPALERALTRRELDVLSLLAEGYERKEIAVRLVVSPKTVATHLESIYRKLGVRGRAEAVVLAYREDLVALPR
jgi:DNA-binding NarL/FixJ family response regulator